MGVGAKSKKTPERLAIVKEMLEEGCSRRACYGAIGIRSGTWHRWLKEDEDFKALVCKAEAVAERRLLQQALDIPRNIMTVLSRRFRQDWSERVQVEHMEEQKLIIEVVERGPDTGHRDSTPNPSSEAEGD